MAPQRTGFFLLLALSLCRCGAQQQDSQSVAVRLRLPEAIAKSDRRRHAVLASQRQLRVRLSGRGGESLGEQRFPPLGDAPLSLRMPDPMPAEVRVHIAVFDDRTWADPNATAPLAGTVTVRREALSGREPIVVPLRAQVPVSYWDR